MLSNLGCTRPAFSNRRISPYKSCLAFKISAYWAKRCIAVPFSAAVILFSFIKSGFARVICLSLAISLTDIFIGKAVRSRLGYLKARFSSIFSISAWISLCGISASCRLLSQVSLSAISISMLCGILLSSVAGERLFVK